MRLIAQNISTVETRAARLGALMGEIPSVVLSLERLADEWAPGDVPVGSVEFVREAMRVSGIPVPPGLSYPEQLECFLYREVTRKPLREVRLEAPIFLKPVAVKLFTGFVLRPGLTIEHYDAHDREQMQVVCGLPGAAEVYTSEVVEFLSEWRFYVLRGSIVGQARYDADGEDDAPVPNLSVVRDAIQRFPGPAAYALDFGVLATGETALVEVNDGWALGLYSTCVKASTYFELLGARWRELAQARGGA